MKVECISNKTADVPSELKESIRVDSARLDSIAQGKQYVVYAIATYRGHVWFYIADEFFSEYPIWHPSIFFKVTDARISTHWIAAIQNKELEMGFKEWIETPHFYDDLTNGKKENVDIFARYKKLMDAEFAEPLEDEA